ncbi:MAG: GAF domain-containing protein [Chloroflexi bacterium]|nr:GAF domain-containing protein [Chloroflexota bacterium]
MMRRLQRKEPVMNPTALLSRFEHFRQTIQQVNDPALRESLREQAEALHKATVPEDHAAATLMHELARQAEELKLLEVARNALARQLDVKELIRTIVESTAASFGYVLVSLYLRENDELVLQHQVGYDQVIERIPVQSGVSGRVVRSGQPILLEDVQTDPEFLEAVAGIGSEICVPLFDEGQVVGTLNVESFPPQRLNEPDLRTLVALSDHVSLAIQRARLFSTIRQSQERYQTLVDNLGEVIYQTNLEGQLTFVNQAWTRITGFSVEETIGKPIVIFNHPDDAGNAYRNRRLLISRQRDSVLYHLRMRTRTGGFKWVEVNARTICNEQGGIVGTAGTLTDITDRRRAEEQAQNQMMFSDQLRAVVAALTGVLEISEAVNVFAQHVAQIAPYDAACVALIEREKLHVAWGTGYAERGMADWKTVFQVDVRTLAPREAVARWGKVVLVPQLSEHPQLIGATELEWVRNRLYVPIRAQRVVIGVIILDSERGDAFTTVEGERVLAAADLAGLAIGSLQDVTQRRQVEKELRQALEIERRLTEQRLRSASD